MCEYISYQKCREALFWKCFPVRKLILVINRDGSKSWYPSYMANVRKLRFMKVKGEVFSQAGKEGI